MKHVKLFEEFGENVDGDYYGPKRLVGQDGKSYSEMDIEEEDENRAKIGTSFAVDPTYTHFAVRCSDNKIVTGWEYKDLSNEEIKYWVKLDLKDIFPDEKLTDFKVYTIKGLKKLGIDPFTWDAWVK